MQMTTAKTFSDEDHHLSEANRLGKLLEVYRPKPLLVRLIRWACFLLSFLSISALVFGIGLSFTRWPQIAGDPLAFFLLLALPLLMSSFGLFASWFTVRQVGVQRVIVGEHGLLKVTRKIRVIYWQEITAVRRVWSGERFAYTIVSRDGQTLTLTNDYQNMGELVALIKQRSAEAQTGSFGAK